MLKSALTIALTALKRALNLSNLSGQSSFNVKTITEVINLEKINQSFQSFISISNINGYVWRGLTKGTLFGPLWLSKR